MKKWIALLLTLAMLLALAACASKSDKKANPPAEDQQTAGVQPEDPDASAPSSAPEAPAVEPDVPAAAPDEEEKDENADDGIADAEGYAIHVSHTDVTLKSPGETFRFTVWDSNGNDPDVCTYTSDDPAVAAVDEAGGEVTAVAPGTTTVTAHVEFNGKKVGFSCIVRCRWEDAETPESSVPVSGGTERASLSDFYSTLQGQYEGLGTMMVMEGELLDNYYPGLSDIDSVEEVLIQETMISISNVAVGMVKLSADASKDDVIAVQNILNARIKTQADGGAWYPASCETWEAGVVTSTANVVGMFVYPDDAQKMADQFILTFGN